MPTVQSNKSDEPNSISSKLCSPDVFGFVDNHTARSMLGEFLGYLHGDGVASSCIPHKISVMLCVMLRLTVFVNAKIWVDLRIYWYLCH